MFDDLKLAPKDEDEMEDFRDYEDEGDDSTRSSTTYEEDEDDEEEDESPAKTPAPVTTQGPRAAR